MHLRLTILCIGLAIRENAPGFVATSINNLAGLHRDQGHYAEAEPLYERALAIAERPSDQSIWVWPRAWKTMPDYFDRPRAPMRQIG